MTQQFSYKKPLITLEPAIVELVPGQRQIVEITINNQAARRLSWQISLVEADNALIESFSVAEDGDGIIETDGISLGRARFELKVNEKAPAGVYSALLQAQTRYQVDNNSYELISTTEPVPFTLVILVQDVPELTVWPFSKGETAFSQSSAEIDLEPPVAELKGWFKKRVRWVVELNNAGNLTRHYRVQARVEDDARANFIFEQNGGYLDFNPPPGQRQQQLLDLQAVKFPPDRQPRHYKLKLAVEDYPATQTEVEIAYSSTRLRRWLVKNWPNILLGVPLLIVFIGVLFFLFWPAPPVAPAECGAVNQRQVTLYSDGNNSQFTISQPQGSQKTYQPDPRPDRFLPGQFASLAAVSPDGSRLSYVTAAGGSANLDGPVTLQVARLGSADNTVTELFSLALPSGYNLWPVAPLWSADNRFLAVVLRPIKTDEAAQSSLSLAVADFPALGVDSSAPPTLKVVTPTVSGNVSLPDWLKPDFLYGNPVEDRPLCWDISNQVFLIRPAANSVIPAGQTKQNQYELWFKDKSVEKPQFKSTNPPRPVSAVATASKYLYAPGANCPTLAPFSQYDPRWANFPLGGSNSGTDKIATAGCLVVAMAILAEGPAGFQILNPQTLLNNRCFGPNPTHLFEVSNLGGANPVCQQTKFNQLEKKVFSWDELDKYLEKSGPAVVGLLPAGSGQPHFVVVTSRGLQGQAGQYNITDPWDGSTYKTLAYYITKGYRPAWLVAYQLGVAVCPLPGFAGSNQASLTLKSSNFYSDTTSVTMDSNNLFTQFYHPGSLSPISTTTRQEDGFYAIGNRQADQVLTNPRLYFVLDHAAPVITPQISPAPDPRNQTYRQPVTVGFAASDQLSGLRYIKYRVVGAKAPVKCTVTLPSSTENWCLYNTFTGLAPLSLATSGTYNLEYQAEDGAGNLSPVFTDTLRLQIGSKPATPTATPTPSPTVEPLLTTAPVSPSATAKRSSPSPTAKKPTSTPGLAPTAPPASPTIEVSQLTPVAVATPLPTAAGTPVLAGAAFVVNPPQLVFGPGVTTGYVTLLNRGAASIDWQVVAGTSATQLGFSPASGTLKPFGSSQLVVTSLTNSPLKVGTSFTINTNVNSQPVDVLINPVALPLAQIVMPVSGATLDPTTNITLQIQSNGSPLSADHAVLQAAVHNCADTNCAPALYELRASAATNWGVSWDTTNFYPQSGISLAGRLCTSSDESQCSPIPAVTGLVIPSRPYSISALAGASQTALVGSGFATNLSAQVLDKAGQPVAGVSVIFALAGQNPATAPGATFPGAVTTVTSLTDSNGVAVAQPLTANSIAGSYSVQAQVAGISSPALFNLTNNPASPVNLSIYAGNRQRKPVNAQYDSLQVLVTDAQNRPLKNVTVSFTAPKDGPSGSFQTFPTGIVTTTETGIAVAPPFVANAVPGAYRVRATVESLGSGVEFELLNVGPPASVAVASGSNQTTFVNADFNQPLGVVVKDAAGTLLDNIPVTFRVPLNGSNPAYAGFQPNPSTTVSSTILTNSNGQANAGILTALSQAGTFNVTAGVDSVPTLPPASFNLTINNRVPIVASLSQARTLPANTNQTITVNGNNFGPQTVIRWNGTDLATTFLTTTQVTAVIDSAKLGAISQNQITAFNPAPGGGTSAARPFSVDLVLSSPQSCDWNGFTQVWNAITFVPSDQRIITFNCGNPLNIPFINPLTVDSAHTEVVVDGAGSSVTLNGRGNNQLFLINSDSTFTAKNITITGGRATSTNTGGPAGGAIKNEGTTNLTNVVLTGNSSESAGGAIYNNGYQLTGILNINNSQIINNSTDLTDTTSANGGAIMNYYGHLTISNSIFENNTAGRGGAILNNGELTVTGSDFLNNKATKAPDAYGGAIGSNYNANLLDISNSTFYGNEADGNTGGGGAIYHTSHPTTYIRYQLNNVTIYNNSAPAGVGGVYRHMGYTTYDITINNSIIYGNSPDDCYKSQSGNNNLEEKSNCAGIVQSTDPLLQPLADNGSAISAARRIVQTLALGAGSPAIDKGGGNCTATDQRGRNRVNQCDIGAYEYP